MSEIDRVDEAIHDLVVEAAVSAKALVEPLQHTIIDGYRRFQERHYEDMRRYADEDTLDSALKTEFDNLSDEVNALAENLPATPEEQISAFQGLARRAMAARRATYDLTNRERPWEEVTPEEALLDEDDQYSYVIIDTMAEKIAKLSEEEEEDESAAEEDAEATENEESTSEG